MLGELIEEVSGMLKSTEKLKSGTSQDIGVDGEFTARNAKGRVWGSQVIAL